MQNLNLSEEEIKIWSDAILQHSFNEEEWFHAREVLLNTTSIDGKKPDEKKLCSYISCCAEAVGTSQTSPYLSDIVIEFYNLYGME